MSRLLTAVLVLGVSAACGGSDASYTAAATQACFDAQGIEASTAEDDLFGLGANGGEGGITVTLPDNEVSIGFERTSSDADDLVAFGELFGLSDEKMDKWNNTVGEWSKTPIDDERETVESCLK